MSLTAGSASKSNAHGKNFFHSIHAAGVTGTPGRQRERHLPVGQDYHGTEHRGPGLDHIGFKVESVQGFKQDVETLTNVDPEWMSPKTPILPSENEIVMGLLARCRYGRHQLCDPEGNLLEFRSNPP